jgi:hypothetical protein
MSNYPIITALVYLDILEISEELGKIVCDEENPCPIASIPLIGRSHFIQYHRGIRHLDVDRISVLWLVILLYPSCLDG